MNEEIVRDLYNMVEEACRSEHNVFGYGIWSHHIKPMVEIAQRLATEYGADREIVTIAALLHDLAGIEDREKRKQHHIHGAERAEVILGGYGYPQNRIEMVKKCILNHRGSVNNAKESREEICIADADAMAHMQALGSLFFVAYRENDLGIDEGTDWVKGKIERDWKKMSAQGQEAFKKRYEAIMETLGTR